MKHHAAPHHDPMDSTTYRQQYRLAWEQLVAELDFGLFVTLNFNRDTTLAGARRMLGLFLARLDRRFLGHRWCRKGPERTLGMAVLENQETNLHIHLAMRLPASAAALSFSEQQLYLESTWNQLVVGGQCDVQAVYDRAGVAHYMAKQLPRRGYAKGYILASEFHNHDM